MSIARLETELRLKEREAASGGSSSGPPGWRPPSGPPYGPAEEYSPTVPSSLLAFAGLVMSVAYMTWPPGVDPEFSAATRGVVLAALFMFAVVVATPFEVQRARRHGRSPLWNGVNALGAVTGGGALPWLIAYLFGSDIVDFHWPAFHDWASMWLRPSMVGGLAIGLFFEARWRLADL